MRLALFHTGSAWGLGVVHALLDDGLDEIALFEAADPDGSDIDVLQQARRVGARHSIVADPRSEACERELEAFAPDILLVAAFPAKLPDPLLRVPGLGAVNVHPSLLPRYRGAHPEFWAIRNGESESGVSLHRMTDRLDAGEIISQARVRLAPDETLGSLCEKLAPAAIELVRRLLAECRAGVPIRSVPQDESRSTYAPMVRPAHRVIHWDGSATEIERLGRACHPWLDASATLGGKCCVVRKCSATREPSDLRPGEFRVDSVTGRTEVGTGDGLLVVLERIEEAFAID